ncbi:MAG: hypothetical protein MI724_13675 [Spirochaetales bacterium]|nr:hypothetical protein [Spirochaetales bacterium]
MKISRLLIALALLVVCIPMATSQEQNGEDVSLQAVTVYVQRVYPHRLGYMVIYNRSDLYAGEVYLPNRWFTDAGGRAEIIRTHHRSAPYMTVFFMDGEFSHVRLFVQDNPAHISWGALPSDADLTDEFATETIDIVY